LQGFCGRRFLIVAVALSIRDNQALSVGSGFFGSTQLLKRSPSAHGVNSPSSDAAADLVLI
jgi:Na+-transporting NADH:ubiquinone oxidoreductase subunit NqrB